MKQKMTKRPGLIVFCAAFLASGSMFAYDSDTLAFYPFFDYPNGTDVTKLATKTFTNAVDDTQYLITAEAKQYWGSLDAGGSYLGTTNDVPGTYLVNGSGYVDGKPIAEHYQAAYLRARPSAPSGHGVKMTVPGLASELSKYDTWTVECFIKVPTASDFSSWGYLIALDAGLTYDGNPASVAVLPTAGSYEDGKWRVKVGSDYPIIGSGDAYNSGWMHIALVCTATELKFFVNYKQVGATVTIAHAGSNDGQDLLINAAAVTEGSATWSGYVAGLRVKKAALTTAQMLHASESPTGLPETAFQSPLEGAVGEIPAETNLVAVAAEGGDEPVFVARRCGRVYSKGEFLRESKTAVLFTGARRKDEQIYGRGNALMIASGSFLSVEADFTMECYMRFDYKTWMEKYAKDEIRPYFQLFQLDWPGGGVGRHVWDLQFRLVDKVKFRPYIGGTYGYTIFLNSLGDAIKTDGKWHHYAITYDAATAKFELFEDFVSLGAYQVAGQISSAQQTALNGGMNFPYRIGYAGATQPFEGEIDEVRLSRRVLKPTEFISVDDRQGMILIFR